MKYLGDAYQMTPGEAELLEWTVLERFKGTEAISARIDILIVVQAGLLTGTNSALSGDSKFLINCPPLQRQEATTIIRPRSKSARLAYLSSTREDFLGATPLSNFERTRGCTMCHGVSVIHIIDRPLSIKKDFGFLEFPDAYECLFSFFVLIAICPLCCSFVPAPHNYVESLKILRGTPYSEMTCSAYICAVKRQRHTCTANDFSQNQCHGALYCLSNCGQDRPWLAPLSIVAGVSASANHADEVLFQKCVQGDGEKYLGSSVGTVLSLNNLENQRFGSYDGTAVLLFDLSIQVCEPHGISLRRACHQILRVVVTRCARIAALASHGSSSLLVASL